MNATPTERQTVVPALSFTGVWVCRLVLAKLGGLVLPGWRPSSSNQGLLEPCPPGWPAVIEVPAVGGGPESWMAVGIAHLLRAALRDTTQVQVRCGSPATVASIKRQLTERWPW